MSRKACACDMEPLWELSWSEWHTVHMAHHLATFPDVDQVTRDNLAAFIARAERREQLLAGPTYGIAGKGS